MKRKIILGLIAMMLFSCGENQVKTKDKEQQDDKKQVDQIINKEVDHSEFIGNESYDQEKMKNWPSQTYRSDGYRPSATSEWIQVIYTPDKAFINTILYWNTNDDTPIEMELIESKFEEGEISGWTGVVKSTDDFFEYGFGIIEDRFNLIFDDEGRMQEFLLELE